jgi:hypothetical protein
MSADELRRAASLMRERAEAATPGPWRFTDSEAVNDVWNGGMVVVSADGDPIANCEDEWYEPDPGEPAPLNDAAHIAAADPPFMLAMAVWLDSHADIHVLRTCDERLVTPCPALAVARAYLGGAL